MAKKSKEPVDGEQPPAKGGKLKKMLMAGVLVLVLGGGAAFFLLGRGGGKPAAAAEPQPGQVVTLSTVTLNLVDGHYLRVGLGLQLAKGATLGEGAEADPVADGAKALDQAITLFGSHTMSSLVGAGKERAKTQLTARLKKAYDGHVIGVYFTEFVMS